MKTSPLDPEVPAQPLSQCLELPLPVAWTEAAGVRGCGWKYAPRWKRDDVVEEQTGREGGENCCIRTF